MSEQVPLEVLKAVSAMNQERYLEAILAGDNELATESLKRMTYALSQIEQYQTKCKCEGDGCSLCTQFCGDCLTPLENCGCKI